MHKVAYKWSISSRRRNALVSWSSGNPERLTSNDKVWLFVVVKTERDSPVYGKKIRIKHILAEQHTVFISVRTIQRAIKKYSLNGYVLEDDVVRFARLAKFPQNTQDIIGRKLLGGASAREVASKFKYRNKSGRKVSISPREVRRIAARQNLVVSVPKEVRIRTHFAHHIVVREAYSAWWLKQKSYFVKSMLYSDEMSFSVALPINKQNDIVWVYRGTQSTTNISRRSKGSEGKLCSLWIVQDSSGIVCFRVFKGTLGVESYHDLLETYLAPVLRHREQQRTPQRHSTYYHDKVTNSKDLQNSEVMNRVFGEGRWLPHSPNICREGTDDEWIAPVNGRIGYWRRKTKACEECECKIDGECVPTASPVLNLCENVNGMVRQTLTKMVKDGKVKWVGNPEKKMKIISRVVQQVHNNKQFWKNLYANAGERHRYVRDNHGAIYRKS